MIDKTTRASVSKKKVCGWGVLAAALTATAIPAGAQTQTPRANNQQSVVVRSPSALTFDIPAQSLDAALREYSRVTGVQLLYDSGVTGALRSAAVSGTYEPADALSRMLAPTGLSPRFTGRRTATLQSGPVANSHAQSGAVVLDPIVVEGEKFARDYFRTPTSIGVVTGERIQQEQILDFHEAINSTANSLSTRASQNNGGITIRGINSEGLSQNQSGNSAPVIAVIVDGAMQNAEAVRRGLRSVWDVEQVEVLRGPQSTLQGRNAAAGAVFIKTKDPTFNWQAMGEQTVGMHDLFSTGLTLSGPLVANELAFRLSGQSYRSDMDINYADQANNVLGEDRFGNIRGKLLWEPGGIPGLRALFTVAYTDDKPGVNSVTGPDYFARVYATSSAALDYRATKTNNYVADVSYAWSPALKVRSVTTYAGTTTDIDSAPGSLTFFRDDVREGGDFTQDLRLEIDNKGNGLSGVVGLFYGKFTTTIDSRFLADLTAFGLPGLQVIQDLDARFETRSTAAYADLKYRIDRFAFIAGGRALRDEVGSRATGTLLDPALLFGPPFTGYATLNDVTDETFTRFLPKLGVTYDLTTNQTAGFTYSQGYRAGFSDYYPFQGTSFGIFRVRPETLDSYEISYRSRWLNDRLDFNANAFYYDYRNQQVAYEPPGALIPGYAIITNANKSHSYGGEIEARYRVTDRLTAYGSVGLLFTRFDDIVIPATGNFSGNEFPEAPSYTVNVGGLYQHPNGWFFGANSRFIDGYYSNGDVNNTPLRYVGSAAIVDARTGWEIKNHKLTLFAKNLFDERYLTSISTAGAGGVRTAGVGDSRTFGLTWTLKY